MRKISGRQCEEKGGADNHGGSFLGLSGCSSETVLIGALLSANNSLYSFSNKEATLR